MTTSSDVAIGQQATAAQYNELRADMLDLKDFWVPYGQSANGGVVTTLNPGDSYTLNGAADYVEFSFHIPRGFSALTSVVFVCIPTTTGDFDWTFNTQFGANGEAINANTDSATNNAEAATDLQILEVDVSAAFTAAAANDYIHARLTLDALNTTINIRVTGLRVTYS